MGSRKVKKIRPKYSFWDKFFSGLDILCNATKILDKFPALYFPIVISWIFYAIATIYFKYYFDWAPLSLQEILIIAFLIIIGFCVLFSISSFILLEFIKQIETGNKINFVKAINKVIYKDIYKAFPIMVIWAIIWLVLTILEAFIHSKDNDNDQISYENVAKTIGGYHKFSLLGLSLDLIDSGIRLIVFFIYPAIAWENEGSLNATKKGFLAIKNNIAEFVSGFTLTEFASSVIFLPPGILFYISAKGHITFPDWVWVISIIYIAFGASLYLYLQQMFAATLYMWNMKWVHEVQKANNEGLPIPKLQDIKKPDLLDYVPDLIF